ncbi:MAG TPA: glycosyltransferase 87 family protein [Streptosporangiaceae bacterium]|nr:glycosyltransferase 87 family protein [Streptosporangiaceae bacterium]
MAVAVGLAVVAAAVAPIVAHWLTNPPDQRLVDLDVYRSGGDAVLRGAPLYDFLTQPPQLLPFTYPPFAALLAGPLALMSWPAAQWAWVVLVYGALAATVCYAFREPLARAGLLTGARAGLLTGARAGLLAGALIGAMAYLMPVRDQIRFGQVDLFLVALCVADCATRSPRWPRGLLIGLATAIKLVPGVFIIYLWLTGRRRSAVTATVAAAAATLAAAVVLPSDSADYWFGALLDSDRVGANNGTANQALRAVLLRMYLPSPVTTLLWVLCVAAVAYAGFRWARLARDAAPGSYNAELIGIAITGLLAVALSPVAWIHHLAWIVVVIGALVGDGRDVRRVIIACGVWLAYVLPLPWWGTRLIGPEHDVISRIIGRIVQSSYGLGAVALILVLGGWLTARLKISSAHDQGEERHRPPRVGTLDP